VAQLVKGFDNVLGPTLGDDDPPAMVPKITLGEAAVDQRARAKNEPEPPATPPATEPPPAPVAPAVEPTKTPPKMVKKPEPLPAPVVPTPPPPAPEPPKPPEPSADDDYIKTLSEEQQEEIALAEFAETRGRKGLKAEMLEYFKKVETFAQEHPELAAESEEFTKFARDSRPKWTDRERRKAEREMIEERAVAKAKEQLQPVIQEQSRKVREMETRPVIAQTLETVEQAMTTKPEREGLEPVDKDVLDAIKNEGYQKALERFPVEAPVVQGTLNATQAWMEITNGLRPLDANNPIDAYLVQFVAIEGSNMLRQSKEVQTLEDGRTFVPLHEMIQLRRTNPAEAAKRWTFDDPAGGMTVADLLANKAVLQVNAKIKALEASGFKREGKKVSTAPGNQPLAPVPPVPPTPEPTTGSPRAGSRGVPGAADVGESASPNALFLEQLYPGASKIVAGK
jgi:hypothetical protein